MNVVLLVSRWSGTGSVIECASNHTKNNVSWTQTIAVGNAIRLITETARKTGMRNLASRLVQLERWLYGTDTFALLVYEVCCPLFTTSSMLSLNLRCSLCASLLRNLLERRLLMGFCWLSGALDVNHALNEHTAFLDWGALTWAYDRLASKILDWQNCSTQSHVPWLQKKR